MPKKLNPLDASWLLVESPQTPMHVAGLQIFTLPKNASPQFMRELFEYFRSFPVKTPPFNYRLVRSPLAKPSPAWETVNDLDIDYHVRHSALPAPGGERELGILISRLHSIQLDPRRPLWECHIIEGLENNRFAIYIKAHHSMLDGMAAVRITRDTLSEDPNAQNVPPPWARKLPPRAPKVEGVVTVAPLNQLANQWLAQFKTLAGVTRSLRSLMRGGKTGDGLVAPYTAPQSVFNVPVTGQRRFATQRVDFARIRRLCEATGGTVNDVVMALCSASIRRYLQEMAALPERPLVANLPVSVRPKDDDGEGNAISTILVSLGTDIPDVKARFEHIRTSALAAKEHLQTMPRAAINNYTMLLMAPFMVGQVTGITSIKRPMFNVVISNVPGFKNPLYLNGAELDALYPVSLIFNGQALNITVFTYVDKLAFSFTADRASLPHVQRLSVYTKDALDEMEQEFGLTTKPRKATRRKLG